MMRRISIKSEGNPADTKIVDLESGVDISHAVKKVEFFHTPGALPIAVIHLLGSPVDVVADALLLPPGTKLTHPASYSHESIGSDGNTHDVFMWFDVIPDYPAVGSTFRTYSPGARHFMVDGVEISEREFREIFPDYPSA